MIASTADLRGRAIEATDGAIGTLRDVLFDDDRWTVRYVHVDTGTWLPGRQVLLPPTSVASTGDPVRVRLTREQVEGSPALSSDEPVSRRWEADLHEFLGYAPYWAQPLAWGLPGAGAFPVPPPVADAAAGGPDAGDPHLRSAHEVRGYHVRADDDEVGHVEDILIDDGDWTVTAMVVDTRDLLPGRTVRVPVDEVAGIGWADGLVRVRVTRADIEGRPEQR
ncbi:PRC-barrel domain-containing protein [Miltoncostaea marina]|uniref:PRC-barrel domain-containing protein n=1 Tax=Miltoncostaea marina TaxID=2843215 RepID=UPI001C3E093A|nr:PRC-barrel domain-containing protein [Miltoncostaea marina]